MRVVGQFALLLFAATFCIASPVSNRAVEVKANSSYVGYFYVHFYDREPSIFAHISNGNNPISYAALNGDNAILKPTLGTKAARDPYLVSAPDNSKHWIIATDLDIEAINNDWGVAVTKGSRGIFVWESTDLVTWTNHRLVTVIGPTAGMVWAPEAIWDSSKKAYLVHWASRLYAASDTNHTGAATPDQIMYAHTTDFKTFTPAQPYIALSGRPVIDLDILSLGGNSYARFIKDENQLRVWEERSTTGLWGTWSQVGGWMVDEVSEGPLSFKDNVTPGLVHSFLDLYVSAGGYVPFKTTNIDSGSWTKDSTDAFPALTKHGVVKPVTQAEYDRIRAKWL
ncbi:glycoside hydrolase family 43 protein [Flagelloscypha sp. PMI_526]|nr:glycoside hydrolase family 43 protein [Flagelloscypha sp. PMI_526]